LLPDQSRVTLHDPLTAAQLDERFDRIPVFGPKYTGALNTNIPATSTWTTLGSALTFYKEESWTNVEITLFMQGFWNTAGATGVVSFRALIDDVAYTKFAEHHWNIAALQRAAVSGVMSAEGLAAGEHTIAIQGMAAIAITCDFTTSNARVLETI
jgi:hypothetical protein